MLQDPNVEWYVANAVKPLQKEIEQMKAQIEALTQALRIHDVVGQSEQFYCTCSRAKGLDHDEEGTPYCISCQKEVQ